EVREKNRLVPLLVYLGGLVLFFLGERVFSTINAARMTLSLAGFGLAIAYFVLRLKGMSSETGERKGIEKMLAIFAALTVVGLALGWSTTEAGERILHIAKLSTEAKDKYETIATIGWIAIITVASIPILFAERALYPMRRAENIEARRVLSAEAAGLTLAI